MKRCPQCEFIYEDDQSLCDMDGVLLVFDSRNLPNHHALATVPAKPSTAPKSCRSSICHTDSRPRARHGLLRLNLAKGHGPGHRETGRALPPRTRFRK